MPKNILIFKITDTLMLRNNKDYWEDVELHSVIDSVRNFKPQHIKLKLKLKVHKIRLINKIVEKSGCKIFIINDWIDNNDECYNILKYRGLNTDAIFGSISKLKNKDISKFINPSIYKTAYISSSKSKTFIPNVKTFNMTDGGIDDDIVAKVVCEFTNKVNILNWGRRLLNGSEMTEFRYNAIRRYKLKHPFVKRNSDNDKEKIEWDKDIFYKSLTQLECAWF